jgi:NAD(P)-dependent dehydrogenase (short-subunit alcohol dehydrogenase family)
VLPVALGVTDVAGLAAAPDEMARATGRVDVLVNNAAVHYDTSQDAVHVDLAVVREALETNLLGAWQIALAFLPLLRRSAHPVW